MSKNHPLVEFREQRGLSRAELGIELGVSEVTIWRWETGKRAPRGDDLRRLCSFTSIPAASLLGVTEAA
jgi:transcriptional regulator with XRE-family HTH domain